MKRLLIATIACGCLFTSCEFMFNAMIYGNRTQRCALVADYWDTLGYWEESGGSYNDACDECYEELGRQAEGNYSNTTYECYCESWKNEE